MKPLKICFFVFTLLVANVSVFAEAKPSVKLVKLTNHIYVAEDSFYYPENSAVYIGDHEVTVISATWTPETAKLLTEQIRKITKKPISQVINTHFHFDRTGGNAFFKSQGAKIIGSEMTAKLMSENWDTRVKDFQKEYKDYPSIPLTLPDLTFKDHYELEGGKIQILYFGPSHTTDDVVVYFPDEQILFGDCVVKEKLGSLTDANLEEYPKTLEKIKQLKIKTIIAGHWKAIHGPELIDEELELLRQHEADAHPIPWQPLKGNVQIPIWPGAAPGGQIVAGPENSGQDLKGLVAGKPWTFVSNVVTPTMTVYQPKTNPTGASVVVFPGGGYQVLAIDLEGTEICDWLNTKGITCALLKYRVPNGMDHRSGPYGTRSPAALQDAQRTIRLLRHDFEKYKIDPKKIGVIGFSAGGHLVAAVSTNFKKEIYKPVDAIDQESARPDFAMALYPGHIAKDYKIELGLNPFLPVSEETPPTFLVHAQNDPVDPVEYSLLYFAALKKNKVPVEMHIFPEGKHAFGLRPTEFPITHWPALAEKWMANLGYLK